MLDKYTYRLVGVFTNQGSRYRARNFINSLSNPMFVIGQLNPWNDEDIPPIPSSIAINISDPYIYIRPTLIDILDYDYCTEDSNYLDEYKDYHSSLFPTRTDEIGKVLISTNIPKEVLPSPFRSIGLVSNVVIKSNIDYKLHYPANQIEDVGLLHWINNLTPTDLSQGGPHTISIVINC